MLRKKNIVKWFLKVLEKVGTVGTLTQNGGYFRREIGPKTRANLNKKVGTRLARLAHFANY